MQISLRIFRFDSPDFQEFLQVQVFRDYHCNPGVLERILTDLASRYPHPCQTVVVEEPYVCKDYLDEFSGFYGASFKDYPASCMRLHFFGRAIPARTAFRFDEYCDDYYGFVVIRPTDLQKVGRTVLKAPCSDPDNDFVLCRTSNNKAHLLTSEFRIDGTPFIQQDTQVGACATAAMWMAARYLSRKFGLREFYPTEITRSARETLSFGRLFPAKEGLFSLQMLDGLKRMGYDAELIQKESVEPSDFICQMSGIQDPGELRYWQFARMVYRYIESEMPVLLLLEDELRRRHAVVAIGHTYDTLRQASMTIQKIPHFIIHDDAKGPYTKMSLDRSAEGDSRFEQVREAIFVIPAECKMRGQDAEDGALQFMLEFLAALPSDARHILQECVRLDLSSPDAMLREVFVRTYLRENVQLKREYLALPIPFRIRRRIARMSLPKYAWVAELSTETLVSHHTKRGRLRLGEIVIDSTAPAMSNMVLFFRFGPLYGFLERNDSSAFWPEWDPKNHLLPQRVR